MQYRDFDNVLRAMLQAVIKTLASSAFDTSRQGLFARERSAGLGHGIIIALLLPRIKRVARRALPQQLVILIFVLPRMPTPSLGRLRTRYDDVLTAFTRDFCIFCPSLIHAIVQTYTINKLKVLLLIFAIQGLIR